MAGPYVWGIDIGKSALKALRCRATADPKKIEAVACEYIEYPMILTQAEADPVALVQEAIEQFLSRHDLREDTVAVAVPGGLGLTKFIKLPPIEAKKIPDIVKYEARQQIPFPLEQVVWRWQRLAGGVEESGFLLDAEIALFAMKREQVFKALAPLTAAGIKVDVLQLAPMALANMVLFDQQASLTGPEPDQSPPALALVAVGVDSTDLVVTNGHRIWQRNMPIGGSNFTKALVQGMKLTFSRAETLKKNAVKAEDPKTVFKTMKPVFNEFAADLQRSLNYFMGTDRSMTIGKVLLMGNATKLRGLSDFVAQQLQLDVQRVETFKALEGAEVLGSAVFREHLPSFGTAYGLALQGLGRASVATNLLPDEIIRDRIIESKKPWAVAALVGLLAAGLVNFIGIFGAWTAYTPTLYAEAFQKAEGVKKQSAAANAAIGAVRDRQTAAIDQQQWLAKVQERRFETLDLFRAVESLLPRDEDGAVPQHPADRQELHITRMDCQFFSDLAPWFGALGKQWADTHPADESQPAAAKPDAAQAAQATQGAGESVAAEGGAPPEGTAAPKGPAGPGWVVEMQGYHYRNEPRHKPNEGAQFLRSTIIKNLMGGGPKVTVSAGPRAGEEVGVAELGIGFPVIVQYSKIRSERVPLGGATFDPSRREPGAPPRPGAPSAPGAPGAAAEADAPQDLLLRRLDFTIQFCWQPPSGRPSVKPETGTE